MAKILNSILANVIKNFKIPNYADYVLLIDSIESYTVKAILKYRNHPNVLAIMVPKKKMKEN